MITDAILTFIGTIFRTFLLLLQPMTDLMTAINEQVNEIIDFFIPIMEYVLYYFNVPVLVTALVITTAFGAFITGEYFSKLIMKYVTRVL